MIRLRPHHLLCMLTHIGRGYTPAFVVNFAAVLARLGEGEPVTIIDGPDDFCAGWMDDPACHCHRAGIRDRDRLARLDIEALLHCSLSPGANFSIDAATLKSLRDAFRSGQIRSACEACEWHGLCSTIAENDFPGVLLRR